MSRSPIAPSIDPLGPVPLPFSDPFPPFQSICGLSLSPPSFCCLHNGQNLKKKGSTRQSATRRSLPNRGSNHHGRTQRPQDWGDRRTRWAVVGLGGCAAPVGGGRISLTPRLNSAERTNERDASRPPPAPRRKGSRAAGGGWASLVASRPRRRPAIAARSRSCLTAISSALAARFPRGLSMAEAGAGGPFFLRRAAH